MANMTISARPRAVQGKKVAVLRRKGILPANIYGHNVVSTAIELDQHDMALLLRRAGRTHLLSVSIEGEREPRNVLVRQVQREPTSDLILHIDFFQVSMREKLTVTIPVLLTGHAPVLDETDATVVQTLDSVQVECLPADIPESLTADASSLTSTTSNIHVSDLQVPANVTVLTDADVVVASVTLAVVEVEEEPVAEETAEGETEATEEATAEEGEQPAAEE